MTLSPSTKTRASWVAATLNKHADEIGRLEFRFDQPSLRQTQWSLDVFDALPDIQSLSLYFSLDMSVESQRRKDYVEDLIYAVADRLESLEFALSWDICEPTDEYDWVSELVETGMPRLRSVTVFVLRGPSRGLELVDETEARHRLIRTLEARRPELEHFKVKFTCGL